MAIMPPMGAAPPPPMPDAGGLAGMLGGVPGMSGPGVGDTVAGEIVSKLRPVWKMVGELVDYLVSNPEIAPAAKSIINMSFGSAKKMGPKRDRAEDALGQAAMPVGPPGPPMGLPGMQPGGIGAPPPLPGMGRSTPF